MRIGLAVIATGKYLQFVQPLALSAMEDLWDGHDKHILVFSDHWRGMTQQKMSESLSIWFLEAEHLGWPGATLYRHRTILGHERLLDSMDYLFMCDADMEFVAPVGDEILSDRVGTIHPGFFNKPRSQWTYENRPQSTAYIPDGAGERYYAGGFQGGRTDVYLKACRTIAENVAKDEANGITAVWHDESHWNRYLFEHPPTLELDPGYCYPESWTLPFERKILALDKDHAAMRA